MDCFKAYDIRGRIPDEINPDLIYQVGRAYAAFINPRRVAVGRDIRLTSEEFAQALIRGLTDSGVDVVDIGLCGTEGVYFATFHYELDGGVMVPRILSKVLSLLVSITTFISALSLFFLIILQTS